MPRIHTIGDLDFEFGSEAIHRSPKRTHEENLALSAFEGSAVKKVSRELVVQIRSSVTIHEGSGSTSLKLILRLDQILNLQRRTENGSIYRGGSSLYRRPAPKGDRQTSIGASVLPKPFIDACCFLVEQSDLSVYWEIEGDPTRVHLGIEVPEELQLPSRYLEVLCSRFNRIIRQTR